MNQAAMTIAGRSDPFTKGFIVRLRGENRRSIVTTLYNVQRLSGNDKTKLTRHATIITAHRHQYVT